MDRIASNSQSAIARASYPGPGPGQAQAVKFDHTIGYLAAFFGRAAEMHWVKGHSGVQGNERADRLAGEAARKNPPPGTLP